MFCRAASKPCQSTTLFAQVCTLLKQKWSRDHIATYLQRQHSNDTLQRVSRETSCNAIHTMPRGELRKTLIALMRRAQAKRMPRSPGEEHPGQIVGMMSVNCTPPEVSDRLIAGHWESDLIKRNGNARAVGSLVERSSRLLMLVHLPGPKRGSKATVLDAFTQKLRLIALPMRQSLTYDQGRRIARHKELANSANIAVYFCDPHGPWQRGTIAVAQHSLADLEHFCFTSL